MAKEIVKAKQKVTALANWEEELAKKAKEKAAKEKTPAGAAMSFRSGQITVAGQPVKDNKAQVVVLADLYENALYEGAYDADNPRPPKCWAIGDDENTLAPHPEAAEPQHEQCKGCPHNEFGTAEKGRGKACKNIRRLALIPLAEVLAGNAEKTEIFSAKLPVTSGSAWAYYVKGLDATFHRPPGAMATQIATVPDPKTQFKVTFEPIEPLAKEHALPCMAREEEALTRISFAYPKPSEEAPAPSKKRKF